MPTPAASEILTREFPQIHCRILDLAAALDRVSRAGGAAEDPRWQQVQQCLTAMAGAVEVGGADRAERCQMAFSLPYDEAWRTKYGV